MAENLHKQEIENIKKHNELVEMLKEAAELREENL